MRLSRDELGLNRTWSPKTNVERPVLRLWSPKTDVERPVLRMWSPKDAPFYVSLGVYSVVSTLWCLLWVSSLGVYSGCLLWVSALWWLLRGGYSVVASLGGYSGCLLCGVYFEVATLGVY